MVYTKFCAYAHVIHFNSFKQKSLYSRLQSWWLYRNHPICLSASTHLSHNFSLGLRSISHKLLQMTQVCAMALNKGIISKVNVTII